MDVAKVPKNYTSSLSCLHTIEHFGLGRYGDKIDPKGYKKGIESIEKIVEKDGSVYFSSPIGKGRTEFNAHRVFELEYLVENLLEGFEIKDFSYVDDNGCVKKSVNLSTEKVKNNYGCRYGCAIFDLTRK
jgi:hypothetical protein